MQERCHEKDSVSFADFYHLRYYSAIKNNEIMPFAVIWMGLDIIILSEVTQRKIITIHYHLYV